MKGRIGSSFRPNVSLHLISDSGCAESERRRRWLRGWKVSENLGLDRVPTHEDRED